MKTIEVVAAIIKQDDKILVTCREYGEFVDEFNWVTADILVVEKLKKK